MIPTYRNICFYHMMYTQIKQNSEMIESGYLAARTITERLLKTQINQKKLTIQEFSG